MRGTTIALVSSSYDPYSGGVEEHVRHVAQELRDRGRDVVVWTVDRGEHLGTRRLDGITVRYLPTPLPSMSIAGIAAFLRALPAAARAWAGAYRADRPGLLHVQCFGPNGVYSMGLAGLGRVPLVVSTHGESFMDADDIFRRSRLIRAAFTRALTLADVVTGCSSVVVKHLADEFGYEGALLVPNGVRPRGKGLSVVALRPGRVVAVGRLEHVKGFDLLIRAVGQMDPQPKELTIVGDGSQRRTLEALAETEGVAGLTTFMGQQDRDATDAVMESAEVVVVPSRREAFGIVVLEAWRAGRPLIATCHDGPGDLVRDGEDGVLINPTDVPSLAAAISGVLADPTMGARLAAAGAARTSEFTWASVAERYQAIYDRLLTTEERRLATQVVS